MQPTGHFPGRLRSPPAGAKLTGSSSSWSATMFPSLDGRAWLGVATAYGTQFVIEVFESKRHPGYYYFLVACLADSFCDEMQRPVKAYAVEEFLRAALTRQHGVTLDDFQWEEKQPNELIFSLSRIGSGDY